MKGPTETALKIRASVPSLLLFVVAVLESTFIATPVTAAPTRYAAFPGEPASDLYSSVTVGGVSVGVHKFAPAGLGTPPLHYARFAQVPSEANAVVVTMASGSVSSCSVYPAALNIAATHTGSTCRFTLNPSATAKRHLYVRINNSPQWLMIFADPPASPAYAVGPGVYDVTSFSGIDKTGAALSTAGLQAAINFVSTSASPRVLYFPAGRFRTGQLNILSGVTLYLTSGAVLSGSVRPADYTAQNGGRRQLIYFNGVSNAAIAGSGIIHGNGQAYRSANCPQNTKFADGTPLNQGIHSACKIGTNPDGFEDFTATAPTLIKIVNSHNVTISGVYLMDPAAWAVSIAHSDGITVDDLKVVADVRAYNNDGIDIDFSNNVVVQNSFINNGDDATSIKTKGIGGPGLMADSYKIAVRDIVIGHSDRIVKLGTETYVANGLGNFHDISFQRISAYELKIATVVVALYHGNTIANVTWDGLTVEHAGASFLVDIRKDADRNAVGVINPSINMRNVTINPGNAEPVSGHINGYDVNHRVNHFRICKLRLNGGTAKTSLAGAGLSANAFTANITVGPNCP